MQPTANMRRCNKCVLPETYPAIVFDEHGVCNYCKEYKKIQYRGEEALEKILQKHRNKKKNYDCMVTVSGGRDSTYVLYMLKSYYDMNPIAFNYDSGLVASQAKENLKTTMKNLGIKLISIQSENNIQRRMFKSFLKLNLRKSLRHVLNQLCVSCKNCIWGGAYKTAHKLGLSLIIFGESQMESMNFRRILGPQLEPTIKDKLKTTLIMPINFITRKYQEYQLNAEFPLTSDKNSSIEKVNFFEYIKWDEEEIVKTIEQKVGWKKDEELNSSWRFDCQIHALGNFLNKKLYNFTEKDELYSKLIREGNINREEALKKVINNRFESKIEFNIIKKVFDKIRLSGYYRNKILNI